MLFEEFTKVEEIPEEIEDENVCMPAEINFTVSSIRSLIKIYNHTGLSVDQIVNMLIKSYSEQTRIPELKNKEE